MRGAALTGANLDLESERSLPWGGRRPPKVSPVPLGGARVVPLDGVRHRVDGPPGTSHRVMNATGVERGAGQPVPLPRHHCRKGSCAQVSEHGLERRADHVGVESRAVGIAVHHNLGAGPFTRHEFAAVGLLAGRGRFGAVGVATNAVERGQVRISVLHRAAGYLTAWFRREPRSPWPPPCRCPQQPDPEPPRGRRPRRARRPAGSLGCGRRTRPAGYPGWQRPCVVARWW